MKNPNESWQEEIIRDYGSLAAYYEEQRRFGLVSIEATLRANPFARIEQTEPPEPTNKPPKRPRFWIKFAGQKAA